jgi:iron complex transport system substrate-binding protein
MKIVSLLPSSTEIVCQLGLADKLVGISHECDYPASITHLPRLTSSRVDYSGKSDSIHQSVMELLKTSVSVYDLNLELLAELNPDFIITQDLCDVCAVSFDQVQAACNDYLDSDAKIISLKPKTLKNIWDDIDQVAKALNVVSTGSDFKIKTDRRIKTIRNKIKQAQVPIKKIITIEWLNPIMAGAMWVPEMIETVGGEALLVEKGGQALTLDYSTLETIDPEIVIIKPCGFKLDQTIRELDVIREKMPWEKWRAYKNNKMFLVDGNAYFNRPGPRIVDSIEILAYCSFPDLFPEFKDRFSTDIIQLQEGLELPSRHT